MPIILYRLGGGVRKSLRATALALTQDRAGSWAWNQGDMSVMRRMLFAVGALLAVAVMSSAPANAAGFALARPDTAAIAAELQQVSHRRHRHRHRAHVYHYRYVQPHQPFAYRYYAVPRYAYRPFYYSTWSYPSAGVYLAPRRSYYHHRHW